MMHWKYEMNGRMVGMTNRAMLSKAVLSVNLNLCVTTAANHLILQGMCFPLIAQVSAISYQAYHKSA
jgi:hypothetical protein